MVAPLRAPHHERPPRPVVCALLAPAGLTLAAGGGANAQEARAKDPGSLFAGKPLEIIVGMPPGGGAGAYARLVQRHLSLHLPGTKSIALTWKTGGRLMRAWPNSEWRATLPG